MFALPITIEKFQVVTMKLYLSLAQKVNKAKRCITCQMFLYFAFKCRYAPFLYDIGTIRSFIVRRNLSRYSSRYLLTGILEPFSELSDSKRPCLCIVFIGDLLFQHRMPQPCVIQIRYLRLRIAIRVT